MVFSRLRALYSRHPLVCNMGIYGSLYSLGDVSQQTICGKSHIDYLSASRVGAVGAGIFGPFYLFWYRALDKRLPGTAAKIILRKVIVDQSIAGAVGTFVFFTATSALEGADDIFEDAKNKWPKAFLTGCVYWPAIQCINFAFVPPPYRAIYVAFGAFVWTNILCYIKSRKMTPQRETTNPCVVQTQGSG